MPVTENQLATRGENYSSDYVVLVVEVMRETSFCLGTSNNRKISHILCML